MRFVLACLFACSSNRPTETPAVEPPPPVVPTPPVAPTNPVVLTQMPGAMPTTPSVLVVTDPCPDVTPADRWVRISTKTTNDPHTILSPFGSAATAIYTADGKIHAPWTVLDLCSGKQAKETLSKVPTSGEPKLAVVYGAYNASPGVWFPGGKLHIKLDDARVPQRFDQVKIEFDGTAPIEAPARDAPTPRAGYSVAATDRGLLVWSGYDDHGRVLLDGAFFDRKTKAWRPLSKRAAPPGHGVATRIGDHILVFGGSPTDKTRIDANLYDPATDSWRALSTDDGPSPGGGAIRTGRYLVVYGTPHSARLDLATLRWKRLPASPLSLVNAQGHGWPATGDRIVSVQIPNDYTAPKGAILDVEKLTWTEIPFAKLPWNATAASEVIWTGARLIVWGGITVTRLPMHDDCAGAGSAPCLPSGPEVKVVRVTEAWVYRPILR